jgi:tyrosinase
VVAKDPDFVKSFERGVRVMKSRDKDDPTSWSFQANIHGSTNGSDPHFDACQHRNWYFLPWHRMYLFFFEQILSAAAETRINLPYWNYSHPMSRALPQEFRRPESPLYEENREGGRNDGQEFGESEVGQSVIADTLGVVNFAPTMERQVSFGGGESQNGSLERAPHNALHNLMGGIMSDPNTAANDPIFWLHHANIDRIWCDWIELGDSRANPTEAEWLNKEYEFYNAAGETEKLAVKDVLETGKLGYVYAADGEDLIVAAKASPRSEKVKRTIVGAVPAMHVIGERPLTLSLPTTVEERPRIAKAMAAEASSFELSLNDVMVGQVQKGIIRVFINKPDATAATPTDDLHYAGYFAFFGKDSSHDEGDKGRSQVIDVTKTIKRLKAEGDFTVTLVGTSPTEVKARDVRIDLVAP